MLVLLLLIVSNTTLYGEYFKHIGLPEGLTQPSVLSIYQDELGRMWFGTREGLNRYDGNRIVSYKGWHKASEQDSVIWLGNEVTSIQGNKEGDIFFLSDGNIMKYDIHTEKFSQLTNNWNVPVLACDRGEIWYMRHDSLFHYSDTGQSVFTFKTGITSAIRSLTLLTDKICIGTTDGVYLIDRISFHSSHFMKGLEIYQIFESSQKQLWIGTRMKGLYIIDKDGGVEKADISSQQIREFVEDNECNVWFGSFDGLWKYNYKTDQFSLIRIPKYIGGLAHASIFSLYKDRLGIIWIGSYYGGVNYFNPVRSRFAHYDYEQNAVKKLYYSYVGEMVQDKDGHLWISTDGGGICCVDKEWNIIHQFFAGSQNSLLHNNIKSICYDETYDRIYVGTYMGGLSRYDIRTGKFHNYLKMRKSGDSNMPNEVIYCIKMWEGQLYISSRNGFFKLDPSTDTFTKIHLPPNLYENFDLDPNGYIYLAAGNYITCVPPDSLGEIERFTISTGQITRIKATGEGVYVGTLGNGVFFFDKHTRQITNYTFEKKQLPSNYCYNICTTEDGKVLFTYNKGVTCYDPQKESFTTINIPNLSSSAHIINECGILTTADKRIYIGDTKGITTFLESEFDATYSNHSNLFFSELQINNQPIYPGDKTNILSQSLPYTKELTLKHDQNNLIISFALSEFNSGLSKNEFKYKLEGFSDEWINTKQAELHYTNLSPGKYTLRLSTTERNPQEISLLITITSPWYNTWWAWLLYIGVVVSCSYYYISSKISKRILLFSLEKERFEKQHIEKGNQEKLAFFTNVSHEFKTPLTLIISHIDLLLQNNKCSSFIYNHLLKIRKNAHHLNTLITELLEFRRLEQKQTPLTLQYSNLKVLLQEIYLSFVDYAHQRNIVYTFECPDIPFDCWYNAHLMEKVFFELLSNAFKYTPDNGKITLTGSIADNKLKINIQDNGVGISEKDIPMVFTQFFRGDNSVNVNRTGIGLALVKSIVERHYGTISVRSTVGEGSVFTIQLSITTELFTNDESIRLSSENKENDPRNGMPDTEVAGMAGENNTAVAGNKPPEENSHTLLIVEDNRELLKILNELFSPYYIVVCASNGVEGLEKARTRKPDLIISDIMMPQMNGIEMCLQMKNNIDLCHIPIILLTALNTIEQSIEGLNRGADDYITKPFNTQLLLARANNLVRNRILIRQQFSKQPLSEIDLTSINPLDKDLLIRASEIIERYIDNTEFDVSILATELMLGRSTLFQKFKALTGMTPNNFILNFRLKYAASLLKQSPDIPIAEVSDLCGFSSHVYFSKCFKKLFEYTPQQYRLLGG
ncbi:hybrid sensor histidine kinase/response regulator transcription factor [Bacteroides sp. UBA939]|uniref:hybrid sensor histidine kinase/response regulator transcription factor n=1 Tax=Bacteroides sp. UBA939 TaxID=1946092 RepID=UPI0025C2A416|nr:response regulator [Bacteroides sp. UBA939]